MFKNHSCVTLACDGCGREIENGDGGTAHYLADDPSEKRRAIEEAEADDWHILRDGRVYCTATKCEALLPDCTCERDCNYGCPVGCPCPNHPEITAVVIPVTAGGS